MVSWHLKFSLQHSSGLSVFEHCPHCGACSLRTNLTLRQKYKNKLGHVVHHLVDSDRMSQLPRLRGKHPHHVGSSCSLDHLNLRSIVARPTIKTKSHCSACFKNHHDKPPSLLGTRSELYYEAHPPSSYMFLLL